MLVYAGRCLALLLLRPRHRIQLPPSFLRTHPPVTFTSCRHFSHETLIRDWIPNFGSVQASDESIASTRRQIESIQLKATSDRSAGIVHLIFPKIL